MSEEMVDMGQVSVEDPVEAVAAQAAEAPAKKARKPRDPNKPKVEKAPAAPKTPIIGGYSNLPTFDVTLTENHDQLWNAPEGTAKKHHQRQVIMDVMSRIAEEGKTTVDKIVTAIEGDAELLTRMKTNQAVLRCVLFHLVVLEKEGILLTSRIKRERKAKDVTQETASPEAAEQAQETAEAVPEPETEASAE